MKIYPKRNKFKIGVAKTNFHGIMYTDVKRALPEGMNMNRLLLNSNLGLSLYYLLSDGSVLNGTGGQ